MTREFKQITAAVDNMTTNNFKAAFKYAEEHGCDSVTFYWGDSKRCSDDEFCNRVLKVVATMTDWNIILADRFEHGVRLVREMAEEVEEL